MGGSSLAKVMTSATSGRPGDAMNAIAGSTLETLSLRERYRDDYRRKRDPICEDRLLWRAQSLRHLVHLLPGETILEMGCGEGLFTRQLSRVSRGENPLTAVSFGSDRERPEALPKYVEFLPVSSLSGALSGRQFDVVVGMDLLDRDNSSELLGIVYELLKPGGQMLFYESNPWNVVLKLRRLAGRLFGNRDPRRLLNRPELLEQISAIGFVRIWAVFNDFVYWPLTRSIAWVLRNLSVLLENMPVVRTLAGSILIQAQKPPRDVPRPHVSLFEHELLRHSVSVVIPCHNEEMNIGPLVTGLRELFGEYLHEIIPVDDNSTDATGDVIKRLASEDPRVKPITRTAPKGVGRALADGFGAATGEWVLSMDCDFQQLLPEVRDFFDAAAEGSDVVVGSRFSRHSVLLNYPFLKIVANRGFHLLAQLVLLRRFRDLTNNLKLMRRDVAGQLQLTQPGFAVNAETGLQPLLMGCKIREVPISWINRTPDMGVSSFHLARVGGGYVQVLLYLGLKKVLGRGPYRDLDGIGAHR
jgi:dolichol-phosphate mannosyltransferase